MNNLFRAVAFLDMAAHAEQPPTIQRDIAVALIEELKTADADINMITRIATVLAESCDQFRKGGEQAITMLRDCEDQLIKARIAYASANEQRDAALSQNTVYVRMLDELRTELSDANKRANEFLLARNQAWIELADLRETTGVAAVEADRKADAPLEVGDSEPWHAPTQAS